MWPRQSGKPARPRCQCPLHTSCDSTTILQVHPLSKQSTQPRRPQHPRSSAMPDTSERCPPWLSPRPQPRSLLLPVCHQSCSPGGPAKCPPCQIQLALLRFLLHYLCSFRHPLFLKSLPPLGFLQPSQPPFPALPLSAAHSWTSERAPAPGRDDRYSLLRSLASSLARHSCPSSHDNQRLLTHKTDHIPQFKTPHRSHLTWHKHQSCQWPIRPSPLSPRPLPSLHPCIPLWPPYHAKDDPTTGPVPCHFLAWTTLSPQVQSAHPDFYVFAQISPLGKAFLDHSLFGYLTCFIFLHQMHTVFSICCLARHQT